jgi:2-oxoglutaroyl-CoA hydrolase
VSVTKPDRTDSGVLLVERDDDRGVVTITLDAPEKLNRVPLAARDEIAHLFDQLDADEAVRAIVLAGAGDKAFSAGGDIQAFLDREPAGLSRLAWNVAAPERCSKPVIAKLRGFVLGVGFELAMASDFRIAADDAQLGLPEIRLGMIPGSGGSQRLARIAGLGRAKDMVMRGKRIPAAEAKAYGIVTEVHPAAELDAAVDALVDELRALSPLALSMAKRVLNHAYEGPLGSGLEIEGLAYGLLRSSHDFQEGVAAFVEKRDPRFTGH